MILVVFMMSTLVAHCGWAATGDTDEKDVWRYQVKIIDSDEYDCYAQLQG